MSTHDKLSANLSTLQNCWAGPHLLWGQVGPLPSESQTVSPHCSVLKGLMSQ